MSQRVRAAWRCLWMLLWTGCLFAAGFTLGCNQAPSPTPEPKTGQEVLERMVSAYRASSSYADSGEVRLKFDAPGQPADETLNFSVTFVRPNKLRLHMYRSNVISDGKQYRATVEELPNQVLNQPAPDVMSTGFIYSNPVLVEALTNGIASGSVQLALLLDEKPLEPVLEGAETPTLLAPANVDDQSCYRVQIKRPDGILVFWIGRSDFVLRRVEYPIEDLQKYLTQNRRISNLSLVADLKGARLNAPVDDTAFKFELPQGAKLVKEFQTIPRPEAISKLVGRAPPDFTFVGLDGKKVTRESLAGKIVVLDFWATWCGPCLQSLPNLEQVYQKYKQNDRVVILAVNIDERPTGKPPAPAELEASQPPATDADVVSAFKQIGLSIPIARDLDQFANKAFDVQQIPNMFILGPDGTVQDNEVGFNPELAKELPERIEKLLAGNTIEKDARDRYEARVREYEAQFTVADPTENNTPLAKAAIAPAGAAVALRVTTLWKCTEVKQPGNILAIDFSNAPSRVLVNDGLDAVVELSPEGNVTARHVLELPKQPEAVVSYLRTTTTSDGRRWFVGTASDVAQLHVFDDHFKRLASHPKGANPGGIADVQLADLDGDGQPEINIGFYNDGGVQSILLDGGRHWTNRSISDVFRMAVTGPDARGHRRLLCCNNRGTLVPIDYQGNDAPAMEISKRFFRSVYAADLDGDQTPEYCGIAFSSSGEESLIGFDAVGKERWSYPLPKGLQTHAALEMVAWGNPLGAKVGQWIIAGSDGSIHFLAADGSPVDHFQFGEAISGIAVARFDTPVLLVATAKSVEALRFDPR